MAKNLAHSLKVRLLNLSDHDNRRYQQLLVRYIQERFLYRLSESKYSNNFILKRGALLYAYDEFMPRPVIMAYPTILEEMESPRITAYSLETVVAEKFQTIVEKNVFNSRMKDFFDLYRIITAYNFDENTLLDAIRATFKNRNTGFSACEFVFSPEFMNDSTLEKRWNAYCHKIMTENPLTFQEIMFLIVNFVKPYWDKLKP